MTWDVRQGDCREVMATLDAGSVDAIVADPPYGLAFMGKAWDHGVPGVPFWAEALRVAKPGAHLVAFGGTRTYHRLACAIEDAGWEIRDSLMWLYGSGFPKSLDVSKAIDKAAGAERETLSRREARVGFDTAKQGGGGWAAGEVVVTAPATDAARQWEGWGTALKPAFEPIIVARKPLEIASEIAILVPTIERELCAVDTFAKTDTPWSELLRTSGFLSIVKSLRESLAVLSGNASRLTTSTAFALTTDLIILRPALSRITHAITTAGVSPTSGDESDAWLAAGISRSVLAKCERLSFTTADELAIGLHADEVSAQEASRLSPDWCPIILARKPLSGTVAANVLEHGTGALNVDGCRIGTGGGCESGEPYRGGPASNAFGRGLNDQSSKPVEGLGRWPANLVLDEEAAAMLDEAAPRTGAAGAKDNTGREHGFKDGRRSLRDDNWGEPIDERAGASRFFYTAKSSSGERHYAGKNAHPTVKPVDLMRWLVRLVTPPGGLVLDPFMGSGSTGVAALAEGARFLGIELDPEHVATARRRIAGPLFAEATP